MKETSVRSILWTFLVQTIFFLIVPDWRERLRSANGPEPFRAWRSFKCHLYLNNPTAFRYVWTGRILSKYWIKTCSKSNQEGPVNNHEQNCFSADSNLRNFLIIPYFEDYLSVFKLCTDTNFNAIFWDDPSVMFKYMLRNS